jgi:DnaK suppressor protein
MTTTPEKKKAAPKKKPAKTLMPAAQKTVTITENKAVYPLQPNEPYMNEAHCEHFRKILKAWLKQLMHEVDNTLTGMKQTDTLPDLNDRATQEESFSLELKTRDRERKLIKKIEEALERIDHKEYGYCESCGIEIGIRRLEARPTAELCIDCKTLAEIREKNVAS